MLSLCKVSTGPGVYWPKPFQSCPFLAVFMYELANHRDIYKEPSGYCDRRIMRGMGTPSL